MAARAIEASLSPVAGMDFGEPIEVRAKRLSGESQLDQSVGIHVLDQIYIRILTEHFLRRKFSIDHMFRPNTVLLHESCFRFTL